jgi:uncharacterized protein YqjF (DUF2071 family)
MPSGPVSLGALPIYASEVSSYPSTSSDPVRWAVMRQEWNDLLFVHWRVPPEAVQQRLPQGVRVDTWDGAAWVGVVAFRMERVGLGRGGGVPYLGSFPEVNVRTYVRGPDGRPGVWFDSLDISRLLPAIVARSTYGLPYMWARMSIRADDQVRTYKSRRRWGGPSAKLDACAEIAEEIPRGEVSSLERFLTCRWGLYSTSVGRLVYAAVEHPEWPLHRATLTRLDETLSAAVGYPAAEEPPLVHWSPGVAVRIGRPRRVRVGWAPRRQVAVAPRAAGS